MEDLISFLCSFVMKDITLWNQYFHPSNAHAWTGDLIRVPQIPSVFFGCLCRLIVVYWSFKGIFKGIDTFFACVCRTYGERWTFALAVLQVGAHSIFHVRLAWTKVQQKKMNLYLPKINWKIQITHRNYNLFPTDPYVVWPQTHTGNNTLASASVQSPPPPPSHSCRPTLIPWWNNGKHQQNDVRHSYKKKNGNSLSKVRKKNDYIQSCNITGVLVISVHCIDCIHSIVDELFVIVIFVVAVCCVEDIVVNVNNVDDKEKTRLKWWQQLCE